MNNCIVARKPLAAGTVAANTLKYGCGSLNIDASRISVGDGTPVDPVRSETLGRWPANLILQHLDGCICTGSKQVKPPNGSGITGKGANGFRSNYVGGQKQSEGHNAAQMVDPSTGTESVAAWVCIAGCPVVELDNQAGDRPTQNTRAPSDKLATNTGLFGLAQKTGGNGPEYLGDTNGSVSRFFKQVGGTVLPTNTNTEE